MEPTEVNGVAAWRTLPNRHHNMRFAYFRVDDSFYFDDAVPLQIEVEVWDGEGAFSIEYDSADPTGSVYEGAFKLAKTFTLGDTGQWRTFSVTVSDARFIGRTNGADFRLGSDREMRIRRVTVRKVQSTKG